MRVSISSLGQDSHRFDSKPKPLILAGCEIEGALGLSGNSDADVLFHALTNAVSGLSGEPFLGPPADALCQKGISDSRIYLEQALNRLYELRPDCHLTHLSCSIEAKKPRLFEHLPRLRASLAQVLHLTEKQVALTATTGEGLTGQGRGEGIQVLCILSATVDLEDASCDALE